MAAPSEFTVQQVISTETWDGKEGPMATDELVFAEIQGRTYKLHRSVDDPAPVEGTVEKGWANPKGTFGRADKTYKASNSSSTSTQDKKFDRRPEHPDNVARMQHTSALSAAPTYIEQMLVAKVVPQPSNKDEYIRLAEGVMTWLESTYPQTSKPVSENGGEPQTAPEPAQAAQDDIPF